MERLKQTAVESSLRRRALNSYSLLCLCCAFLFITMAAPVWAAVPNAPSGLAAAALSSTQIKLTWTDNSTDESSFRIEYKKSTDLNFSTLINVSANTATYTHTNLTQNTDYIYRVQAYNASGFSAYSNEVSATTLTLNAPTNLSASASYTKVTLTWTDNSMDESGFYIEKKIGPNGTWGRILILGANTTTYPITGLTQGTEYYFRVQAYSGSYNSSGYTNEVSATTPVLAAPSDLTATALSSSQIRLTWMDNSTDETYFTIEYKKVTDLNFSSTTAAANTTSATITNLVQNTSYVFRIKAYHSATGTYSAYSNEANATTSPFTPPSNLTAVAISSAQVKLTWTDNTNDEMYFYVDYKVGASGTYTTLPGLSANMTTYTHTNLAQNTTYYYRVRGYSTAGVYSTYSNEANAVTPVFTGPSNLTAAPLSTTQVKLTWRDNSADEANFSLEYRIAGVQTYTVVPSIPSNTTTYTHTGLTLGTTYYYRIRAYNGVGYSSYSNDVGTATPECTQEGTYQP